MAKIDLTREAGEHRPESTETIEVRPWDQGGTEDQQFFIGSGANAQAHETIWLEIIYSVEGAQIFYTRNFLHLPMGFNPDRELQRLEALRTAGEGVFGLVGFLPETSLTLKFETHSYPSRDGGAPEQHRSAALTISADTGAVFGFDAPSVRVVEIKLDLGTVEEGVRFMQELVRELEAVFKGKHPDPAGFPAGSSDWPLIRQLNRRAYNELAESYQDEYFSHQLLAEAFTAWLAQLPAGGQVLDVGCGHGNPVIQKLLESGFQATGTDFSPEMLKRAGAQFPQAAFVQKAITQLDFEAAFDGACSFSSLLYLDPIDLYNAIYRLHQAIKPGGLLFLFAFDNGPDWRGEPFNIVIGKWMWTWHYGMEEAARRLEEHGYFQVLEHKRVMWDEEEEQKAARDLEEAQKKEAEIRRQAQENPDLPHRYFRAFVERPSYAYVIVARRAARPDRETSPGG